MFKLRYYQEEAVAAVEREWAAGNKKTLIVLSTGLGKTVIASGIVKSKYAKLDYTFDSVIKEFIKIKNNYA